MRLSQRSIESSYKKANPSLLIRAVGWMKNMLILIKPRVMILAIFTGIVGAIVAPTNFLLWDLVFLFFVLLLGSSGAAILNMWGDRYVDMLMKRTQNRPLPRGEISSLQALISGLFLSFCAINGLWFFFNGLAALFMLFSIGMYAFYTLWLKMRTPQNIVIGGIAGAFPPLIGWIALMDAFPLYWLPWTMFLVIFLWTPAHFWALALNHVEQYREASIPMLPVVRGESITRYYILFYTVMMIFSTFLPMITLEVGIYYGCFAFVLGIWMLITAFQLVWYPQQQELYAQRLFFKSLLYLFLLFVAILGDYFLE